MAQHGVDDRAVRHRHRAEELGQAVRA
jgi:hypothetical protein